MAIHIKMQITLFATLIVLFLIT